MLVWRRDTHEAGTWCLAHFTCVSPRGHPSNSTVNFIAGGAQLIPTGWTLGFTFLQLYKCGVRCCEPIWGLKGFSLLGNRWNNRIHHVAYSYHVCLYISPRQFLFWEAKILPLRKKLARNRLQKLCLVWQFHQNAAQNWIPANLAGHIWFLAGFSFQMDLPIVY